jgi:hypothetical protein
MRTTASVMLLMTLFAAADAEAARRRGASPAAGESERAARAEMRSRAAVTQVCRGCGLVGETRPNRGSSVAVPNARARFRGRRGTTVYGAMAPLPLTSRAEWHLYEFNRSQAQQQQWLQFQQQTQFELNQLRNELHRDFLFR